MSLELTEYFESEVEGSMKEQCIMKLYVAKGQFKKVYKKIYFLGC